MKLRNITLFLLSLALIATTGGSAFAKMRVAFKFDPFANFKGLKTYKWNPDIKQRVLLDEYLRGEVETVLENQGFQKSTTDSASFLVSYGVTVQKKKEMIKFGGGPSKSGEGFIQTYTAGTLIIDILGADGSHILWRGWAEAKIHPKLDEEKRKKIIQEAVAQILQKFPPK
jgi:hypothetical protein